MMRTTCQIDVIEIDGRAVDANAKDKPVLLIESDWRNPNQVALTIGGKKYTVRASDVRAGVDNAVNRGGV